MLKNITIYTTNSCAYCDMVKRFLKSKNYEYEEINIEENPERGQEAFVISGQLSVPVTLVTTDKDVQEVVIGYNLSKLIPALTR